MEIIINGVDTSDAGIYTLVLVENGCASKNGSQVDVDILLRPSAPTIESAIDSFCGDGSQLLLCVEPVDDEGTLYYFEDAISGEVLSDISSDECQEINYETILGDETARIIARAQLNGCPSDAGEPIEIHITDPGTEDAEAGDDIILCDNQEGQLDALVPMDAIGVWTSIGDVSIQDVNDPNSQFTLSGEEPALAVWSLSKGFCPDFSIDSVSIVSHLKPTANDDFIEGGINTPLQSNVLDNDQVFQEFSVEIVNGPTDGSAVIDPNGILIYTPVDDFIGIDQLTYRICDSICIDLCSEAVVEITIGDPEDCTIPTIFTPNRDGINDFFLIPCLAAPQYADNSVTIFNSYGNEVFRASPYQNDWDGTYNGDDLPEGTYFFIVEFGSVREPADGFLEIKR